MARVLLGRTLTLTPFYHHSYYYSLVEEAVHLHRRASSRRIARAAAFAVHVSGAALIVGPEGLRRHAAVAHARAVEVVCPQKSARAVANTVDTVDVRRKDLRFTSRILAVGVVIFGGQEVEGVPCEFRRFCARIEQKKKVIGTA